MDEETKKRIAEIKAREQKATTEGPWKRYGLQVACAPAAIENTELWIGIANCYTEGVAACIANAEFIAHARQDVPFLLDALEKAHAEIARLTDEICDLEGPTPWKNRRSDREP